MGYSPQPGVATGSHLFSDLHSWQSAAGFWWSVDHGRFSCSLLPSQTTNYWSDPFSAIEFNPREIRQQADRILVALAYSMVKHVDLLTADSPDNNKLNSLADGLDSLYDFIKYAARNILTNDSNCWYAVPQDP